MFDVVLPDHKGTQAKKYKNIFFLKRNEKRKEKKRKVSVMYHDTLFSYPSSPRHNHNSVADKTTKPNQTTQDACRLVAAAACRECVCH